MDTLGVVLIARLGSLRGISHVNDAEGNDMLGQLKHSLKVIPYSLLRICAAPHSAKSEIDRAKKDVLDSRRAVLYPIFGDGRGERAACIARNNDRKRGIEAGEE